MRLVPEALTRASIVPSIGVAAPGHEGVDLTKLSAAALQEPSERRQLHVVLLKRAVGEE